MEIVKTKDDLVKNFKTLDNYLKMEEEPKYTFALNLIKRGICFIAVKVDEENYKFYPSRFVGYLENDMEKHENNFEKDGRITNPAITQILNQKLIQDESLNTKYENYCEKLGFTARSKGSYGITRKFWLFNE